MSDRIARVLRIQVSITDDKGHTKHYWCAPIKPADRGTDVLRAFRLTQRITMPSEESCGSFKWVNSKTPYTVCLHTNSSTSCTCQGWQSHRHCKHASSLVAAGLLDQDLIAEVEKKRLELNMREEELERALTAARKEHDDAAELLLIMKGAFVEAQAEEETRKAKPTRKPRKPRKQFAEAMA